MIDSPPLNVPRKSILRARQPQPITPLSLDLSRRIPPEVIDIIIEKLVRFDIPTLAICSLVSKAWLVASRYRLFPAISLNRKNVKSFLKLLDSPHSTISWGIHHISIHHSSTAVSHRVSHEHKFYEDSPGASNNPVFRCDEALLGRLSRFTSLTSLSFSWIQGGLDPPTTTTLIHGFPGLTDLEFRACTFPSFSQFTEIICALRNLRRITLADVSWLELHLPETPPEQNLPPGLQTVELYIAPIGHFCTWLALYSSDLLALETIRLCSAFWEDMDVVSIAWLLRRLGPKIKHLSLPWHLPEVDLSHQTELQSLHITHLWFQPDAEAEECFTAHGIEKTLLQLSSKHIEIIALNIMVQIDFNPYMPILDWKKIAKILARPCFAHLQAITFGVPIYDKKLRTLLRKIWKTTGDVYRPTHRRQRSSSKSAKKVNRLRVDESFSNKDVV